MTVTAKLAFSQLKINRSRTLLTLIAIALSTALTTAVCSFVASGNGMFVELLGSDYGAYGSSYIRLLLIPALLFGSIIVAMSVIVISNVFRISATERSTQFGILKCVGATEQQIKTTVMYESVFLSAVGIPVGIILGLCLAFAGTSVANVFLDDLNDLTHIMMEKIHLSIDFVFSWQALLAAVVISFVSVLFSAWLPAHKTAKTSAVDSVRGTGAVKIKNKKPNKNFLISKLFGFEGTLAAQNIKRNRRNFRATVIALSTGVILFICLGALSTQASKIEALMRPDIDQTVLSEYTSARIEQISKDSGKVESIYSCPIDSEIGNIVTQRLADFDGKSVFGTGMDSETYFTVLPENLISKQMLNALASAKKEAYKLSVEIITLDEINYRKLCQKADVPSGSTILLNHYRYNDNGKEVDLIPFLPAFKDVKLIKFDKSNSELKIHGELTQEDIPKELFYPKANAVRLVVPQAQVRGYAWYSAPSDVEGYIEYGNAVLEKMFPKNEDSSYMDEGFNTRVYKVDDYMEVMNIAVVLVAVFMYSFVVLLMLIGFTNVVSTISTNVLLRLREFAVLQSVGMTPEGLRRMLNLESILCSLKALLLGVPVGLGMTYLINLPIRSMYPIPYELPWFSVLLCAFAVFLIIWGTTRYAAHRLKNQNIIETIRSESGR